MDRIIEKAAAGGRLDFDEALTLYRQADTLTLASLADRRRWALHPNQVVTYVVDRNINYTNVCVSGCKFCAFFKAPGDAEGYVLTEQELRQKIEETLKLGGTQVLLQGGMHPDLGLGYYVDLLGFMTGKFPIHVHGFSPPEIAFVAYRERMSIKETIGRLMDAGLGSIPGGGAEILVDEVRGKISPNKCTADIWLEVMRTAHGLGLRTTATMMFGHVETERDRVEHLMRIRDLQDETGGFTAFIPWTFQPENTRIDVEAATATEYLRTLALSRVVLDNIGNVQASWVTQGAKIAQTALFFGANDLGSTMIEENVVAAAGVSFRLSLTGMVRLIETAGFTSRRRDCFYNLLDDPLPDVEATAGAWS